MPFQSLRDYLKAVEARGDLLKIDGADRDEEIGALAEIVAATPKHPMVLFDKINGFPAGYRVSANTMGGVGRMALGLGLDPSLANVDLVKAWKEKLQTFKRVEPREVANGPVRENVFSGENNIDLLKFPAPKWHEKDGGYYLGSGCCVITRDPDDGWVNMGVYRVVVHDKSTLGIFINHIQHGRLIVEKYWARGKSCPVAISFGQEPALYLAAAQREPWGVGELGVAGWLRGEPVEVLQGETGLPIPAHAEIAVEGEIPPIEEEARPEGPFGERTGYYATGTRNEPVVRVTSLMHRNDPIIQGDPPLKPVPGMDHFGIPLPAAGVWSALESAGIQDVRGVWLHGPFATVISLKQRYEGHARQAAAIALGVRATVHLGRFVILVDDDIDPSDLRDVFWAITTRCDPAEQTEVLKGFPTSGINPRVAPEDREQGHFISSKMIIDACRPYRWIKDFPATNALSAEKKSAVEKKWRDVLSRLH